jgi:hypothetical protein
MTATLFAVNITAHPLSRICPTESGEFWAKPGSIWACLSAVGNEGRSKVAVCVDAMTAPFDRWNSKEDYASCLFLSLIEGMGYSLDN